MYKRQALYVDGRRHVLRTTPELVSQANQAMQTLARYTTRLNEVTGSLSALEIEDLVTVRDVAVVLQRLEMVRRIHAEIAEYVLELGIDGRLLTLQLEELTAGLDDDLNAVILDYLDPEGPVADAQGVMDNLSALTPPSCSTSVTSPSRSASRSSASRSTRRSARADCASSARSRACRAPSSTGSSSTSARCSDCSRPASTT